MDEQQYGKGEQANCCLCVCQCSCFRRLVSLKKRRFLAPTTDLDLTYITNRIIAVGFPSVGCEACYRNPASAMSSFLHARHPTRSLVFNLCLEDSRGYGPERLPNQKICRIGFIDHNPPRLEQFEAFHTTADAWLWMDPRRIIAVHCKAGKGRTGTMIVAYLVHCGAFASNVDDCLQYYGWRRHSKGSGVTIPSQQRFVRYSAMQSACMRWFLAFKAKQ